MAPALPLLYAAHVLLVAVAVHALLPAPRTPALRAVARLGRRLVAPFERVPGIAARPAPARRRLAACAAAAAVVTARGASLVILALAVGAAP